MLALTPVLGLGNTCVLLRDLQMRCSSSVCFILLCLRDVKQIVPLLHLCPPSASFLECRCLEYREWLTTVVKALMKSFHFYTPPVIVIPPPLPITGSEYPGKWLTGLTYHPDSFTLLLSLNFPFSLFHLFFTMPGLCPPSAAFSISFFSVTLSPAPCRLHWLMSS